MDAMDAADAVDAVVASLLLLMLQMELAGVVLVVVVRGAVWVVVRVWVRLLMVRVVTQRSTRCTLVVVAALLHWAEVYLTKLRAEVYMTKLRTEVCLMKLRAEVSTG